MQNQDQNRMVSAGGSSIIVIPQKLAAEQRVSAGGRSVIVVYPDEITDADGLIAVIQEAVRHLPLSED